MFGAVNGAVLTTSTAKIDAEIGKLSLNIPGDRLGDESFRIEEKPVNLGFTLEKLYDGRVFSGKSPVFRVTTRIGKCSAVEDETTPVARLVLGKTFLVGEGTYGHGEFIGSLGLGLLPLEVYDVLQHLREMRQFNRQGIVLYYIAQVVYCQRNTLQEGVFTLEIATITVGTESLENPYEHVSVEVLKELVLKVFVFSPTHQRGESGGVMLSQLAS